MGEAAWNVMRLGNLGRLALLWLPQLFCCYLRLLYDRLRRSASRFPRSLPPSHWRPACIVTGATSGIGKATAAALALQGFHVILAGRSAKRLKEVVAEIETLHQGVSLQALQLDLCSSSSILTFAKTIRELFEGENPPGNLQLLVNNAGILAASQRWTSDGFDCMMASNYLGPYLLTQQLLPLLQKSAPWARIVNVVSFTHHSVQSLQIDEGHLVKGTMQTTSCGNSYSLVQIYESSKMCLLLFSYELHRRLHSSDDSSHISVVAADPGAVNTDIWREVPVWLWKLIIVLLMLLGLLQSPAVGAASVVDAALAPWEVSGKYFFGGKGFTMKSSKLSYDRQLASRLWEASAAVCDQSIAEHRVD